MKKGPKVVALAALVCFLTMQCVSAAPGVGIEMAGQRELPSYLSIDIPVELGVVDALYEAPSGANPQFILHIQNAHANYQAQVKIKQLLQLMNKKYGFKTIFVEGASEKLDPDSLRLFPDQERNLKLCDELAKQGQLTGAELFLMEQTGERETRDPLDDVARAEGQQVEALGVEQASLYKANYDALKKVFGAETDVTRFFKGFDGKLDNVASKTFTPQTRELIADWKRFEQGRRDFMPFVKGLAAKYKKILKVDLESLFAQVGWPQISRLLVIQQLEKELNKTKGIEEQVALINKLREKGVSKGLLSALENFDEGNIAVGKSATEVSPREVLERLASEAGPKGFKFSDYPAFSLYAGYVTLRAELDSKVLFGEIEYLFTQMLDTLTQEPDQKTLLALYRDGELLRKLLHLELNRAQWRQMVEAKDRVSIPSLVMRLKDAVKTVDHGPQTTDQNKKNVGLQSGTEATNDVMPKAFSAKMSELFTVGLEFYNYAHKREAVFYKEMQSAMVQRKITKAILITGGFHTDGMSDLFRENAVSYGIVTPRLSEKSDENLYRSVMLQNKEHPFELSYLEARLLMGGVQPDQLASLVNAIMAVGPMTLDEAVATINSHFKTGRLEKAGSDGDKPLYQWVPSPEAQSQAMPATPASLGNVTVEMGAITPVGVAPIAKPSVRSVPPGLSAKRSEARLASPEVSAKLSLLHDPSTSDDVAYKALDELIDGSAVGDLANWIAGLREEFPKDTPGDPKYERAVGLRLAAIVRLHRAFPTSSAAQAIQTIEKQAGLPPRLTDLAKSELAVVFEFSAALSALIDQDEKNKYELIGNFLSDELNIDIKDALQKGTLDAEIQRKLKEMRIEINPSTPEGVWEEIRQRSLDYLIAEGEWNYLIQFLVRGNDLVDHELKTMVIQAMQGSEPALDLLSRYLSEEVSAGARNQVAIGQAVAAMENAVKALAPGDEKESYGQRLLDLKAKIQEKNMGMQPKRSEARVMDTTEVAGLAKRLNGQLEGIMGRKPTVNADGASLVIIMPDRLGRVAISNIIGVEIVGDQFRVSHVMNGEKRIDWVPLVLSFEVSGNQEITLAEYKNSIAHPTPEMMQEFAKRVASRLSKTELKWLQENREKFSTESLAQVLCGIVAGVDVSMPGAESAVIAVLKAYMVELRSGQFDFGRFLKAARTIVEKYPVFNVSSAEGRVVRDLPAMPGSGWFENLALRMTTNTAQKEHLVIDVAGIGNNRELIETILRSVRETVDADGKRIGNRLTASFVDDVVKGMVEAAAKMTTVSENIYPVLYTESALVRAALVKGVDSLFGTIVFGERRTVADDALSPMRDVAAMKLSQQKQNGKISSTTALNKVLGELLKELPGVFTVRNGYLNIENSALAGLARVLSDLVAIQATSVSA